MTDQDHQNQQTDEESAQICRVVFQPSGRQGSVAEGMTVLDAARSMGVGIENICGGRQTCAKCRISVGTGQFPKYAIVSAPDRVTPVEPIETSYREKRSIRADERLACIARVCGDVVIDVPPEAQAQKQVIRKAASTLVIEVNPAVRQVYVEVDPAVSGDRRSDWERVQAALSAQWDLHDVTLDARSITTLGKVLREGHWTATVSLWMDREVIRIRPGYVEGLVGLAVDLGTTTIAAYLCDLRTGEVLATETAMNPQIAFGEDLMSRVSYGMMNADGVNRMHRAVIKVINEIAAAAAKAAGLRADDICDMVVVGNTIMHHLFLGIDPVELGGSPFTLTLREAVNIKARELALRVHPGAYLYMLPCQAGHVGADCTGVALAEAPQDQDELTLVVDVGTNAEILLGDKNGLMSASSPTGPAFEGAQIRHGQRAAPGAIERVRIDPGTLAPRFKIIGQEAWSDAAPIAATGICGSGIIEAVAEMFLSGIISADGRFNADHADHGRIHFEGKKGVYTLATADQSATGSSIVVTQDDVRAIQLAKAALYAGIALLLGHVEGQRIARIELAGAFGSYIDPQYAMILGLIPDCDLAHVAAVGNAAGDGARIALLNQQQRLYAEALVKQIHYVETATAPGFQDAFVEAIHIPHMTDEFPHLAEVLAPAGKLSPAKKVRRRVQ